AECHPAQGAASDIAANPSGHVVVALFPGDTSVLITDPAKPIFELASARGERQRQHGFDIRDAIETIQRGAKHFRSLGRSDQGIDLVGLSNEMTGENLDSVTGGTCRLCFRQKLIDAPPAQ